MKCLLAVFLLSVLVSCSTSRTAGTNNPKIYIHLDENGEEITAPEYQKRWRNKENNLVRYDYIAKDTGRVASLFSPRYSKYLVKQPLFFTTIEEITGKEFPINTIFLIEYKYVNDLCSAKSTNHWNQQVIKNRKSFYTPNKEEIEKRNSEIVVLNFFEEGISLSNSPNSREEYFFQDKDNFLRSTIFRNPSFCGSYALIKPNGQTLVRNGESHTLFLEKHLEPKIWDVFFPDEKLNSVGDQSRKN